MPARLMYSVNLLLTALLLLMGPAVSPTAAAAADEEIKCAQCSKAVKQSKAIKVIKNGKVYYVCSADCAKKLNKK
jgi:hypothetical protein